MRTARSVGGRLVRSGWAPGALAIAALALGSCGGPLVTLPYPSERAGTSFADSLSAPRIFLGTIQDLRAREQREGQGHFFAVTYPGDQRWSRPVDQLYREALAQDLTQTRLAVLTPQPRQAAYTLDAEIFSFGCRLQRSPVSFLLPLGGGMMGGMVFGETPSDRVKLGAAVGLALMIGLPMPAEHRAECEVRLTLRDDQGDVVWQESCLGESSGRIYVPVTSSDDKKLAEKHLPRAVKRCNACLLGQLRQHLVATAAGR